ncbi:MAG: helix-turn-helix domain-containing protein [Candidatus Altiarchaeota archaeon]|nr:helix-turn-helix domain-containing protein [Candidatus Altiarchaeota archaeon]
MKLPCEHAMWYVLPRIRAELARILIKRGLSQKDAAERLGITPAAVSQYLHKKRGETASLSAGEQRMFEKAAVELAAAKNEKAIARLICRCCNELRGK